MRMRPSNDTSNANPTWTEISERQRHSTVPYIHRKSQKLRKIIQLGYSEATIHGLLEHSETPAYPPLRAGFLTVFRLPFYPPSTLYSHSVLFSVILRTADRYLSVKAGHAPVDYEYFDPNMRCFPLWFRVHGWLEFTNEYSGLAVTPAHLYCFRRTQAVISLDGKLPLWS